MGVAATFEVEVPASSLALAETFDREPEVTVEMERAVGRPDDEAMRSAWISGVKDARTADLLAADASVREAEKLAEDAEAELFGIEFGDDLRRFVETVFEFDGVVLEANAAEGVWSLRLRFPDRGEVGEAFDDEFCRAYEATITRLYGSNEAPTVRGGVTDKQRQALCAAFEMGYYSVPRTVDLRTVGDRLGISRQAVSERLRRGHELLVGDFLGKSDESE